MPRTKKGGLDKPKNKATPHTTKPLTQAEVMTKLAVLDIQDKQIRNATVCALIGHSSIRTFSWGYNYCGRCEAQLGDSLAGIWKVSGHYIEGHDDEECLDNLQKMTWRDKLYVPKKIYTPSIKQPKGKG